MKDLGAAQSRKSVQMPTASDLQIEGTDLVVSGVPDLPFQAAAALLGACGVRGL